MAARPRPLSALHLCKRLASASIERLDATISRTKTALQTNLLLTAAERNHYAAAIQSAEKLRDAFRRASKVPVPKQAPSSPKRGPGRPSRADLDKGRKLRDSTK